MAKNKYYVVWKGRTPGIYREWTDCEAQVKGFAGAIYKGFASVTEAALAFEQEPPANHMPHRDGPAEMPETAENAPAAAPAPHENATAAALPESLEGLPAELLGFGPEGAGAVQGYRPPELPAEVRLDALAVDAACSGNPGPMEYRGVCLATGLQVFHLGPLYGTNNVGEYLAIVHALALLKKHGRRMVIYSDSRNALLWVKARRCRTKLERTPKTEPLFQLIERADRWLQTHDFADIPLLKWETKRWGEVPADFGRK